MGADWFIDRKDPVTGEWIQPPYKSKANGDEPTVTDGACGEYRFRLVSAAVAAEDQCNELQPVEKEKEIQFAGFTLEVKAKAEWPNQDRSQFGPSEVAEIHVDPPSSGLIWTASFTPTSQGYLDPPASGVWFGLPSTIGSYTVSAKAGSCVRRVTLEVIPPTDIEMNIVASYNVASSPCGNAVQILSTKVLPDTVNFSGIKVREGISTAAQATGSFDHLHGRIHSPMADWSDVEAAGNTLVLYDASGKTARPDPSGEFRPGIFSWTINVHWKPKAGFVANPPKFTEVMMSATVNDAGEVCVTKHSQGPTCKPLGSGGNNVPPGIIVMVNGQCGG